MKAKVLIADDDRATRLLQERILASEDLEVLCAGDGLEAWQIVGLHSPDLVLCDWMMPGLDGVALCRKIKADPLLRAIYVIIVTAKGEGQDKFQALEAGADEFLSKPVEAAELKVRVKVGLRLVEYQKGLRETALTDDLTGLANRRAFQNALERETARARRYQTPLSLLVLDVNRFKTINDRFGHSRGDAVLRFVAQRIIAVLRRSDLVFRIGGDEFAVLLAESHDKTEFAVLRLREAFGERDDSRPVDPDSPTISVGMAAYDDSESTENLFRRADADMYEDKTDPRRSVGEIPSQGLSCAPEYVLTVRGNVVVLKQFAQQMADDGCFVELRQSSSVADRKQAGTPGAAP